MNLKALFAGLIISLVLSDSKAQDLIKPLPKFTMNINLAGLLQMGPIIQSEFRLGSSTVYFAPYLRIPYAGLFYQASATNQFHDYASPKALGLGLQFKTFVPKKMGALYFGAGADYSFGSNRAKDNSWEGQQKYMWIMATAGVRWRDSEKRTVYSVGLLLGPTFALEDYRIYKLEPGRKEYNSRSYILPMVEFSIGWEK